MKAIATYKEVRNRGGFYSLSRGRSEGFRSRAMVTAPDKGFPKEEKECEKL
jgi:hypothetical protein